MNILVLGGTGAMGKALVPILATQGHTVTVTSRKPHSAQQMITYLCGNPHEQAFFEHLIRQHWDAIVDFMVYDTEEFAMKLPHLLAATQHYIFLSSSRVYADAKDVIREDCQRLLDAPPDPAYLSTKEYALEKARAENLLHTSEKRNWTIVRPYITYNSNRLQLGVLEKESWLLRALEGRSIVFARDIAEHLTTLTYGGDVAAVMAELIGNTKAMGECVHITSEETACWQDILDIYLDVLEKHIGTRPHVVYTKTSAKQAKHWGSYAQIYYDRLYDRRFSNQKATALCGLHKYTPLREGLERCLVEYLSNAEENDNRARNWNFEGYADQVAHEPWQLHRIPTLRKKVRYTLSRVLAAFTLKLAH